jgi:hypothetical protein
MEAVEKIVELRPAQSGKLLIILGVGSVGRSASARRSGSGLCARLARVPSCSARRS